MSGDGNLAVRPVYTWDRLRLILLDDGFWHGVRSVVAGAAFDPDRFPDWRRQYRYEEGRQLAVEMQRDGRPFTWTDSRRIPPTVKAWLHESGFVREKGGEEDER